MERVGVNSEGSSADLGSTWTSFLVMLVFCTWWLHAGSQGEGKKRSRASFGASPISCGSKIHGCLSREAAGKPALPKWLPLDFLLHS